MASCEKCWAESGGDAEHYRKLVHARNKTHKRCTYEEQAGPAATVCTSCGGRTVHQYAKICMRCFRKADHGEIQPVKPGDGG